MALPYLDLQFHVPVDMTRIWLTYDVAATFRLRRKRYVHFQKSLRVKYPIFKYVRQSRIELKESILLRQIMLKCISSFVNISL